MQPNITGSPVAQATAGGRQSNMEALRIVAMSMILIHHFLVHGLTPDNIPHNLYYAINGFVYSGVNIFFLLSGYFTIRYSGKGLIKFILTIILFGLVNLALLFAAGEPPAITKWLLVILFPISKSPYWFISVYLLLYVTAPILNAGLKSLERTVLRNTLLVLLFFVFYGFHSLAASTYLHAMYLYCIGYYIGKYKPFSHIRPAIFLTVFFASVLFSNGCDWFLQTAGVSKNYFHSYSNILIFFAAISLLLYFRNFNFSSRKVNAIASASLGCYLLQDGSAADGLYTFQIAFLHTHGYGTSLLLMFATCFIAIWTASIAITSAAKKPLAHLSSSVDNYVQKAITAVSRNSKWGG